MLWDLRSPVTATTLPCKPLPIDTWWEHWVCYLHHFATVYPGSALTSAVAGKTNNTTWTFALVCATESALTFKFLNMERKCNFATNFHYVYVMVITPCSMSCVMTDRNARNLNAFRPSNWLRIYSRFRFSLWSYRTMGIHEYFPALPFV